MNEKRKKVLLKRQAKLKKKKEELMERAEKSEDVNEVRAIYERMKEISEDLQDITEELEIMEDESNDPEKDPGEAGAGSEEERSGVPVLETGAMRGAQIVGAFRQTQTRGEDQTDDPADTLEYRQAFMEFACRNTPIPPDLLAAANATRAAATTTTEDAGAVIPTTIMNQIIQKMESYGNVYALVTKLNIQGGVNIPVLSLKPEAKWINEESPSEDQKTAATEQISFSYFSVECKIAQTILTSVVTLDAFQKLFVPLATEAIVKAIEIAIFNGNGTTQPLGILNDKRIPKANVITMSEDDMTWDGWHKTKSKMKKAYRQGTFFMNQATFDERIDGMKDKNGQPIGRINYGINGEETYRFMGKTVETVEEGCLPAFDEAAVGDVFAVFMMPKNYIINTNQQMTTVKWTDHDYNKIKNKCMMICDGKLGDVNGVLIIKKGKSSTSTPAPTTPSDQETEPQG